MPYCDKCKKPMDFKGFQKYNGSNTPMCDDAPMFPAAGDYEVYRFKCDTCHAVVEKREGELDKYESAYVDKWLAEHELPFYERCGTEWDGEYDAWGNEIL